MTKVKDAHVWMDMNGRTPLEKMINAYLTCTFVTARDMPADECLVEAKKIISIVRAYGEIGHSSAAFDQLGRDKFRSGL